MPLTVTLNLPPALEEKLRKDNPRLDADVAEAYALELFRRGRLSHCELSQVLSLDRFETDAYLKRHGIYEGSPTAEDLEADRRALEGLLGGKQ